MRNPELVKYTKNPGNPRLDSMDQQSIEEKAFTFITDSCANLIGLQKTLRHFPDFLEEEALAMRLADQLKHKLIRYASNEQLEALEKATDYQNFF